MYVDHQDAEHQGLFMQSLSIFDYSVTTGLLHMYDDCLHAVLVLKGLMCDCPLQVGQLLQHGANFTQPVKVTGHLTPGTVADFAHATFREVGWSLLLIIQCTNVQGTVYVPTQCCILWGISLCLLTNYYWLWDGKLTIVLYTVRTSNGGRGSSSSAQTVNHEIHKIFFPLSTYV